MELRSILRGCITPWVLLGAVLISSLLMAVTFLFIWWTSQRSVPSQPGTAIVHIIAAPTAIPVLPTPTSSFNATPQTSDNIILVGTSVIVSGTGGDGLRLRFSPGLESKIRLLAPDGTQLQVMDGPQQMDNYTWWYLENPGDRNQRGWAVADFLSPVPSP
jgi:hypothetical protein